MKTMALDYNYLFESHLNIIDKIIWHYDITAVLKYVIKKDWFYNCDNENANITKLYKFVDYWERWTWSEKIWNIQNKPLNLYTDQQDKELLELLQKFQWTNKNDSK